MVPSLVEENEKEEGDEKENEEALEEDKVVVHGNTKTARV